MFDSVDERILAHPFAKENKVLSACGSAALKAKQLSRIQVKVPSAFTQTVSSSLARCSYISTKLLPRKIHPPLFHRGLSNKPGYDKFLLFGGR